MNEYHFDAEITLSEESELGSLDERVYSTDAGAVRVRAEWSAPGDVPVIRVPLTVIDERANGDARDIPAFVELFFHDAFLLFNLARPGSFAGVIAVSGGEYRVRELAFDARSFLPAMSLRPLSDVVRWYDSLRIGTRQVAASDVEKVIFHLLHLARAVENDETSVIRLAQCMDALSMSSEPLFALRDAIARGNAPVIHPMYDDALDARVADFDWTGIVDDAAAVIIGELHARISGR